MHGHLRFTEPWGRLAGALAALLLVGGLALSPYRYFMLPLAAAAGLVFLRVREPATALLAGLAYLALANLEGFLGDTTFYPSEVVLLAAIAVIGARRPAALRPRGASLLALALAGWMAAAALAGAPAGDTAGLARGLRTAFLSAAIFTLAHGEAARRRGVATWIDAAAGAAGLFGLLALGEAALGLRHGGVPRSGSPVGGSELLAIHLTLLAPPALALAALGADRSRATRALLAVSGLALAVSFSRSGWVGGWAAILGMGLLAFKVDRRGARRLVGGAALLGVAGVAGATVLSVAGPTLGRYGERLGSLLGPALFAGRAQEWGAGLATVRAHPLFGHSGAPNPYNLALGIASASGLPALALFAALVVAAWRAGWQALAIPGRGAFAVGLLGATIGLLVTGIGEASLGARITPPAMAVLGLLAGLGASGPAGGPAPSPRARPKR